jgi:hypothetical protein
LEQSKEILRTNRMLVQFSPDEIRSEVNRFLDDFEKGFDAMKLSDKKVAIRKLVEMIVVDRKERKVRCYLKRLPSLEPLSRLETSNSILGAAGSLKPNLRHPVGDFIVTEMDLA